MNNFSSSFKSWLPLGLAITMILGVVYVGIQQNYRMSANDPQIQVAEDNAASLSSGKKIDTSKTFAKVNIKDSLSPFVMVFDGDQKSQLNTAMLDGSAPDLPADVLDSAKSKGETRITWQPEKGVRIALVVKYFDENGNKGYVAVGRSLREVESRIANLGYIILVGWLITMLATYFLIFLNHSNGSGVSLRSISSIGKKKK